jgi:hypothetical protein
MLKSNLKQLRPVPVPDPEAPATPRRRLCLA